jgi:hypothetical protein
MQTVTAASRNGFRRRAANLAIAAAFGLTAAAPMAAIIDSGVVNIAVPSTSAGVYINWATGVTGASQGAVPGWDFNPYHTGTGLGFYWNAVPSGGLSDGTTYTNLAPGAIIGPAGNYLRAILGTANFKTGGSPILGFRFQNEGTGAVNYGYALMTTTATDGFPATIVRYFYDDTGAAISVISPTPVLLKISSRKVHGPAGPFDLALTPTTPPAIDTNPVTEPRTGPTYTLAFTYDRPIASASLQTIEGTFSGASGVTPGNEVVWTMTGVTDQQYLTFKMFNITAGDGSIGADVSARVGMLLGDVNQTRVVSVADLGLVNAQLSQPVTAANYLKDVNITGTLTVADKGITNLNLTHSLPAP